MGNREVGSYTDSDATLLLQKLKDKKQSVSSIKFTVELLSSLFRRAMKRPKEWSVEFNPFESKQPKDTRGEHEQQDSYNQDDIRKIFMGLSMVRRLVEPEKFWVPLTGLYTGMRLNEASQLRLEDVEELDGVWVFQVRHRPEYSQTVKGVQESMLPCAPYPGRASDS